MHTQASADTHSSPYYSSPSPVKDDIEAGSRGRPAGQFAAPSSSTVSSGTDSLPGSPSHAGDVPAALLRNAAEIDSAAAIACEDNASQHSPVPKASLVNAAKLDHAASTMSAASVRQDSSSSETLLTQEAQLNHAAVSVSEADAHQHEPLPTSAVSTAALLNHAAVKPSSINVTQLQSAKPTSNALTPATKSSADFTRISADTDGQLNVVEKVYMANPAALASMAVPEAAWAASNESSPAASLTPANAASTTAAHAASMTPAHAAPRPTLASTAFITPANTLATDPGLTMAALSPAAASVAADALLEASLTDLAHEPNSSCSKPNAEMIRQHPGLSTDEGHDGFLPLSVAPHPQHSRLVSAQLAGSPKSQSKLRAVPPGASQPKGVPSDQLQSKRVPSDQSQPKAAFTGQSQPEAFKPAAGISTQAHSSGPTAAQRKHNVASAPPQDSSLAVNTAFMADSSIAAGWTPLSTAPPIFGPNTTASPMQTAAAEIPHFAVSRNAGVPNIVDAEASSPVASGIAAALRMRDAKDYREPIVGHRQHSPYAPKSSPVDRDALLRKVAELQRQLNATSRKLQVQKQNHYRM